MRNDEKQTSKRYKSEPIKRSHANSVNKGKLAKEAFACDADAWKAMKKFEQTLHDCRLSQVRVVQQAHPGKRGRPKQNSQPQAHSYHLQATLVANQQTLEERQRMAGRFILATKVLECERLCALEGLAADKQQPSSERGCRLLKDPLFFTASVFLKAPQRIMALAMVMALCLLVYTLAQRKLRQVLSEAKTGIPNQLGKLTATPTMRWVFQCFQSIQLVLVAGHKQISNLTPRRRKLLPCLGASCGRYYLLE